MGGQPGGRSAEEHARDEGEDEREGERQERGRRLDGYVMRAVKGKRNDRFDAEPGDHEACYAPKDG